MAHSQPADIRSQHPFWDERDASGMVDGLTGIANRRCFDARLDEEWRRHVDGDAPLVLLMVDVDCFKALNDALGHLQGDECWPNRSWR